MEEATWKAVVLIPNGKTDYRGIGLMEVVWKVVTVILNRRFTAPITFYDVHRGFRAGSGTGTASLEAKLFQNLAAMREEVLYAIFLVLHKVCNALYRNRLMDILEGFIVGPRYHCILCEYW